MVFGSSCCVTAVTLAVLVILGRSPDSAVGKVLTQVPVIKHMVVEPAVCPLTGRRPTRDSILDRPALALKIENLPSAYPDSGLEKADIVFEEPVEGGLTRFVAVYHCGDAAKAGPVRSARPIDPVLIRPMTRLLADGGGAPGDLNALRKAKIFSISGGAPRPHEILAGGAMRRISRPGMAYEHTLYANTAALRKLGEKHFGSPPPDGIFNFGEPEAVGKKAHSITVNYQNATIVNYHWRHGMWMRYEGSEPFVTGAGKQLGFQNVLVLQYKIDLSKTDVDVLGNGAPVIRNPTGTGKAFLFRDGHAVKGRWTRKSLKDPMTLETKSGQDMVLHPGHTIIEVLPNNKGQIEGKLSFKKR
jgi:Protein of unknown function (DUF3048) N-terminal domain/Protein of unknown function (DUF3048) C-terminal domain